MFNFVSKLLRFFVVISERHMGQVLSWWSHCFVQEVESAAFSKVVLVPILTKVLLNKLWFVRSRLFVEADSWKRNSLLLLDCRFFTFSFIGTFISCFLWILEGLITSLILGSLLSPRCDNSSIYLSLFTGDLEPTEGLCWGSKYLEIEIIWGTI